MNAVYLPAVMTVLGELKGSQGAHAERRWFHPFSQKCLLKNVDIDNPDLLTDAQKLLEMPLRLLEPILVPE